MKKLYIKQWGLTLIIGICNLSCDNFLTEEPKTVVTNLNYWKTEQDVQSAVYGMQGDFRSMMGDAIILYRDRGLPFDVLGSTWEKISNNDLSSYAIDNPRFLWGTEYDVIAGANLIIDNIHRADLSEDRYNFYLGQALCIRAYTYFCLIRYFGDVPLIVKSEDTGEKARTAWQEVANFIIDDLKKATELLPRVKELKNADGSMIASKQIPTCHTANAILAHIYAWVGGVNHQPELLYEGIKRADLVINSGDYELASNPEEVCEEVLLGNSREGVFELDYQNISPNDLKNYGSYIAGSCQRWPIQSMTTPATKRTPRINNSTVMALYPDVTDKRRNAYFYKLDSMATRPVSTTQGAAYIQKWRHAINWQDGSMVGRIHYYEENDILIRLADILLLRAEMKAQTGNVDGAISDLNAIRRRAGAKEYTTTEGNLSEAIATERERELFLEGTNTRYFDIVRNGTFREKLLGNFKTLTDEDVKNGALYLPVGADMARFNTLATQTPYWTNEFPF